MKIQVLFVIISLSAELYCHESETVEEKFYWGILDFKFPNASARNVALSTGSYIPNNNILWSMGIWKHKIFVSLFRYRVGVASSFNYFSMKSATKSPLLIPYPSFDANYVNEDPKHKTKSLPSNSSIICTGYFRIDKCDRLWVLDAGLVNFFGTIRIVTEPALVIFDLNTNKLLRRYTIPAKFVNSNTVFINLDIDISGDCCENAYAYIVDMFRSIVVYSLKKNRSWRLVHHYFGSDPYAGNFFFNGINFQWNFGVVGITIGERHHDSSKRVYISSMASTKSYYISNKVLQDEAYIAQNKYLNDVHLLGDRGRNGQIYTFEYDEKSNVLFETQFNRWRISCWNTANPYNDSSFAIAYQSNRPFFPDDIRIDRKRNIWMLDSNLPTFLFGSWNADPKNIRIYKTTVHDLISGTVCEY